ncbi:MAG: tetratricopeptide repeat protein [Anaerolineae bacterium]|nr:tetratricopeptide repeat protein [Anaerolineae bacterium]
MLAPGQKIFEYEIIRQLGQGGFATVFEARDRHLDRHVAIKQLLLNRIKDESSVKRFIQEARVAATLAHPNVVTIYALRIEDKKFYMIMEYLPGGSLRQLLNKQGHLPVEQAVNLTVGICEGLAKFHDKGILHRDIKGENILLTTDGRPKIIDFGIAHVPETAGGLVLTQAGFQPSTLLYSSPEQVRGEKLDARSDVYQIGEMLYYMLSGQHYIDLDALEARAITQGGTSQFRSQAKLYELLEQAICEEMPAGLKTLWREVGALAGVVERAMSKDKVHRFKDAAEFAATLRTLSINTTPVSPDTDELTVLDSRAYNKRGLAHVSTRNYEQAIVDYSKAIRFDPQYAEAYVNRSTAHLLMGNYGQAVLDCNQAQTLAPDFVAAYTNRGIAYTGLRDYDRALADYEQSLVLSPRNVYAFFNRGNTYLWMSQYQEAVANYSQAIALDPDFVAAYVNRGVAHSELKNNDLALADFTQAIDLNPDYVYAYYNRANVYRELQEHKKAIADYGKVVDLNPEHRYAYENRGDSYAAIGDEELAAEDYTRIITQTSAIHPKRLSVARSMLMPATPLDFLTRE